jgi:cellulose synthase/poly-beta-1,6-N-acetylglucosamine synthase-like glycosyltransferase
MSIPTVAICIPTYNQAAFLETAVRSALAQTHPCEVWVSDDASTDETPEVMARLKTGFPRIQFTRQTQNLGMSGNPRWIVQQPHTDFIVKLDSDDQLHAEYVSALLKVMRERPQVGYAHTAVQEIDQNGVKRRERRLARNTGYQTAAESLMASVSGYRVAANICMFRRQALEQVNYYRTDMRFADDWDLAVRLADAGWGNVYVNELLASYRVWDTAQQTRARRKLDEINGIQAVLERSLQPAFQKRNWDTGCLYRARRCFALRHAECLRSSVFSAAEKVELRQGLCRLGDSVALRWKFCWINTPLAPLFQLPITLKNKAKTLVKRQLFR